MEINVIKLTIGSFYFDIESTCNLNRPEHLDCVYIYGYNKHCRLHVYIYIWYMRYQTHCIATLFYFSYVIFLFFFGILISLNACRARRSTNEKYDTEK